MLRSSISSSSATLDLGAAPVATDAVVATPRANRMFVVTAAIAFAVFFAVDWYLFANRGFLRAFGPGTQEGQVLGKLDRAPAMAEAADVILFGSSYVRSGVAGQPFLDAGLLPFNYAVSGGGPVYDYFALRRIAPVLERRQQKPVLLVEIKPFVLQRYPGSVWSEYPQYIAVVRSRLEMLRHGPLLWRNFRDFGMTSQFISSVLIPSSIYRSHAVGVLGARVNLDDYFFGTEDFSGFAALVTRATPAMAVDGPPLPPVPTANLFPGKLAFLREFLALAQRTGSPIVLYATPSLAFARDSGILDPLIDELTREFPGIRALRTSQYQLEVGDFDEGGHPNLRGSDKMARQIIAALGLAGDKHALGGKLARAFEIADIPPVPAWTLEPTRGRPVDDALLLTEGKEPVIGETPPIAVTPEREWLFEADLEDVTGRVMFVMLWHDEDSRTDKAVSAVSAIDPTVLGPSNRVFLRARPTSNRITLRVVDYSTLVGAPPATGRVRALRLWASR